MSHRISLNSENHFFSSKVFLLTGCSVLSVKFQTFPNSVSENRFNSESVSSLRGKRLSMGNCVGFDSKDVNPSSTISANNPPTPGSSRNSYSTTTMDFSATTIRSTGKIQFSAAAIEAANEEGSNLNGQILEAPNLREFSFADLKSATKNFKLDTLLGKGGFGNVYKGWIDERTFVPSKSGIGMVVAIKSLTSESMQGLEEWKSEINFLGRVSHPNLVKLVGYCLENKELLLVYELMQRESLENHLFSRNAEPLSWELRLKIAIGAARGLAFLHSLDNKIVHRDVKPSNILLDENYNAKISDFGLAKLGPSGGDSHVTTRVMGTNGYAAPEYIATGHLYMKSDVYGFGVVLLELLTGLRAFDVKRPNGQQNLVDLLKPILSNKKKLKNVMDIQMEGQYSSKAMMLAAQLSSKCIESDPKSRVPL